MPANIFLNRSHIDNIKKTAELLWYRFHCVSGIKDKSGEQTGEQNEFQKA